MTAPMPLASSDLVSGCLAGDVAVVRRELGGCNNLEIRTTEGWTPLIMASYHGHSDLVEVLIQMGANPNATNFKGTSVLMYAKSAALRDGNFKIMDLLIEAGADPFHRDKFNRDIRSYAEELKAAELVEYITKAMAKCRNDS